MFIGICDDDNIMRERIERVCKDVTKKYNEETIIKKYNIFLALIIFLMLE